jgi:hypothetical protein
MPHAETRLLSTCSNALQWYKIIIDCLHDTHSKQTLATHLFSLFFVSYFLKWKKYICQRFTTYGFNFQYKYIYDWNMFVLFSNAQLLHIITQIHASCSVAPSSRCSASLWLTFQNLKSVLCWCSKLFYMFYWKYSLAHVHSSLVTPKYT